MRTTRHLVGLLVGALLLAACGGASGGTPADAAAVVNGTEIPLDMVETMVKAQVDGAEEQLSGLSDAERNEQIESLQRNVLTGLISVTLIEQIAEDRGIEVTDEDVEQRWQDEIGMAGGEEELRDLIASIGLDEEQARRQLRASLYQEKLREQITDGVEVTDEEVRALYDERGGDQEQVRARHILVETEEEAQEILTLLDEGADFAELAQERSTGPSGPEGGDLGLAPRGSYVEEFENAVWNAEAGDTVGPVQTQFGFHVIRVEEFVTGSFADQEEALREELQGTAAQDELRSVLTTLFQEAEITVDSRFGEWDAEAGQVVPEGGLESDTTGQQAPGGQAPATVPATPAP